MLTENDIAPYHDEQLAEHVSGGEDDSEEERDTDGLTPTVLEARYDGTVSVDSWLVNEQDIKLTLCELVPVQGWFRQMFLFTFRCSCECCQTDTLVGSLEFRCC